MVQASGGAGKFSLAGLRGGWGIMWGGFTKYHQSELLMVNCYVHKFLAILGRLLQDWGGLAHYWPPKPPPWCRHWYKLSKNVVSALTVDSFKRKLFKLYMDEEDRWLVLSVQELPW